MSFRGHSRVGRYNSSAPLVSPSAGGGEGAEAPGEELSFYSIPSGSYSDSRLQVPQPTRNNSSRDSAGMVPNRRRQQERQSIRLENSFMSSFEDDGEEEEDFRAMLSAASPGGEEEYSPREHAPPALNSLQCVPAQEETAVFTPNYAHQTQREQPHYEGLVSDVPVTAASSAPQEAPLEKSKKSKGDKKEKSSKKPKKRQQRAPEPSKHSDLEPTGGPAGGARRATLRPDNLPPLKLNTKESGGASPGESRANSLSASGVSNSFNIVSGSGQGGIGGATPRSPFPPVSPATPHVSPASALTHSTNRRSSHHDGSPKHHDSGSMMGDDVQSATIRERSSADVWDRDENSYDFVQGGSHLTSGGMERVQGGAKRSRIDGQQQPQTLNQSYKPPPSPTVLPAGSPPLAPGGGSAFPPSPEKARRVAVNGSSGFPPATSVQDPSSMADLLHGDLTGGKEGPGDGLVGVSSPSRGSGGRGSALTPSAVASKKRDDSPPKSQILSSSTVGGGQLVTVPPTSPPPAPHSATSLMKPPEERAFEMCTVNGLPFPTFLPRDHLLTYFPKGIFGLHVEMTKEPIGLDRDGSLRLRDGVEYTLPSAPGVDHTPAYGAAAALGAGAAGLMMGGGGGAAGLSPQQLQALQSAAVPVGAQMISAGLRSVTGGSANGGDGGGVNGGGGSSPTVGLARANSRSRKSIAATEGTRGGGKDRARRGTTTGAPTERGGGKGGGKGEEDGGGILPNLGLFKQVKDIDAPDEGGDPAKRLQWLKERKNALTVKVVGLGFTFAGCVFSSVYDSWLSCECTRLGFRETCVSCIEYVQTTNADPVKSQFEDQICVRSETASHCKNPNYAQLFPLEVVLTIFLFFYWIIVIVDLVKSWTPRRPFYVLIALLTWSMLTALWAQVLEGVRTPVRGSETRVQCSMAESFTQHLLTSQLPVDADGNHAYPTQKDCNLGLAFWITIGVWIQWTFVVLWYFWKRWKSWRQWGKKNLATNDPIQGVAASIVSHSRTNTPEPEYFENIGGSSNGAPIGGGDAPLPPPSIPGGSTRPVNRGGGHRRVSSTDSRASEVLARVATDTVLSLASAIESEQGRQGVI